ncbi:unnamed protein product [Meloidogyne enterolobii]|uniref:Uncharacterized protein n=1 Tax=Meloidogyne enterolobii TaxID=390850 RepID=A0ACB0XRE9_MELEN
MDILFNNVNKIKIKSSFLLISNGFSCKIVGKKNTDIELSSEFLMLPGDHGHRKLSIKHVIHIEFMDNSEQKEAGLVIHVNIYGMRVLRQYFAEERNETTDYKRLCSRSQLIVFDILNYNDMHHIRQILSNASIFHHNYLQEPNKSTIGMRTKQIIAFSRYKELVESIPYRKWSLHLNNLGFIPPIKLDQSSQHIPIISRMQNDQWVVNDELQTFVRADPKKLNKSIDTIQEQPNYLGTYLVSPPQPVFSKIM